MLMFYITWFILSLFLQASHADEKKCQNYLRTSYCNFDSSFNNMYSLTYKGINYSQNSTHGAMYFSYNISSIFQPAGITVRLSAEDGNLHIITDEFNYKEHVDGALFIRKNSLRKEMDLKLLFSILHPKCRLSRYKDPKDPQLMSKCKTSLMLPRPDPPTTTDVSTQSTVFGLRATATFTLSLTISAVPDSNVYTVIIVVLSVFGCFGLTVFCFISKRNRLQNHLHKDHSMGVVTIPEADNEIVVSVKLFLIFVSDHQIHLNVLKHFASFLQGDLNFEVSCEIFQTLEYSQDPVVWMDKCLNDADKVLVIWSHNAVSRWKQYNKKESVYQDLFTPVLKHIYKDLFRRLNREKYYFGFFDCFPKENIPREFINETNFRLMDEFEDLYYRLKSIEPYVPGGEIKEERVMYDHYNSSQYGNELHKAIQEINLLAQSNPDWYVQSVGISSSEPDQNIQLEINCNVLNIQPPSPIVIGEIWIKENDSTANLALDKSMNNELLISHCSTMSIDSTSNALIKIEDLKKEELVPDQNVDVCAVASTLNLQLQCNQTCSKLKQDTFVQSLQKQSTSMDSCTDFDTTDCNIARPNLSIHKVTLPPLDFDSDPMRSLIALNQFSNS